MSFIALFKFLETLSAFVGLPKILSTDQNSAHLAGMVLDYHGALTKPHLSHSAHTTTAL